MQALFVAPGSLKLTGSAAIGNRCTATLGAGVPLFATVLSPFLLHFGMIHLTFSDFAIFTVMYTISGLGVTVGMHRFFTHKSFEASPATQVVLAACGMMALQGGVTSWVAGHRRHHRYSDQPGDIHSPLEFEGKPLAALRALYFIHFGRLFLAEDTSTEVYAPDMLSNRLVQKMDRLALLWVFLTLALPTLAGWLLQGGFIGAFSGFMWGGLVRIFIGQNIGSCVNSLCHMFGQAPFKSHDQSKNNVFVGVAAFGEGWHNNHHAFPSSAKQGLQWWQLDLSYTLIATLKRLGLAYDVKVPTREMIARKMLNGITHERPALDMDLDPHHPHHDLGLPRASPARPSDLAL